MGCCDFISRTVLFVFNLACSLLGLGILGLGVYLNIEGKHFQNLLQGELTLSTILLIVVGGAVFLIAFFGCCGAIREDPCCLNTYGVILSALLLCQIAVGILAFVYRNKVEKEFTSYMEEEFDRAIKDDPEALKTISDLQKGIHCCGLDGPTFWQRHSKPIPKSCCDNREESCSEEQSYKDGCKDKSVYFVKGSLYLLGVAALSVGIVELLGIIFAFCLASSIRRRELRGYA